MRVRLRVMVRVGVIIYNHKMLIKMQISNIYFLSTFVVSVHSSNIKIVPTTSFTSLNMHPQKLIHRQTHTHPNKITHPQKYTPTNAHIYIQIKVHPPTNTPPTTPSTQ